eukprot:gene6159-41733_t
MGNRGGKKKDEDAELKVQQEVAPKTGPSYGEEPNLVQGLEDPTERVRRLSRTQSALCMLQLMLCIIVFVFAFVNRGQGEKQFRTLFGACIGTKAEVSCRLFFVFQMWGLSTLTMYLYVNVALERQSARLCNPTKGDYGTIDRVKCDEAEDIQH